MENQSGYTTVKIICTICRTRSIFLYEKKCVYIAYTDGFSNDHFRNKIQDYK